jgi:hypothetical protein
MAFKAKCTIFSEGCRGHLGKGLMKHFKLNAGKLTERNKKIYVFCTYSYFLYQYKRCTTNTVHMYIFGDYRYSIKEVLLFNILSIKNPLNTTGTAKRYHTDTLCAGAISAIR